MRTRPFEIVRADLIEDGPFEGTVAIELPEDYADFHTVLFTVEHKSFVGSVAFTPDIGLTLREGVVKKIKELFGLGSKEGK